MTIILPEGKAARRKALFLIRYGFLKRRILRRISKRYRIREFAPGATFVREVKFRTPDGKKHKMLIGQIEFKPFTYSGPVHPDGLTVRINHDPDNLLDAWNWFDTGSTEDY